MSDPSEPAGGVEQAGEAALTPPPMPPGEEYTFMCVMTPDVVRRGVRQMFFTPLRIVLYIGMAILALAMLAGPFVLAFPSYVGYLGLGVVVYLILMLKQLRNMVRRSQREYGRWDKPEIRYVADEAHLAIRAPGTSSETAWQMFHKFVRRREFSFLYLNRTSVLLMPHAQIPEPAMVFIARKLREAGVPVR